MITKPCQRTSGHLISNFIPSDLGQKSNNVHGLWYKRRPTYNETKSKRIMSESGRNKVNEVGCLSSNADKAIDSDYDSGNQFSGMEIYKIGSTLRFTDIYARKLYK